jgi:hypothetical protein
MTNRRRDQHYRGSDLGNGDNGGIQRHILGEDLLDMALRFRSTLRQSANDHQQALFGHKSAGEVSGQFGSVRRRLAGMLSWKTNSHVKGYGHRAVDSHSRSSAISPASALIAISLRDGSGR